MTNLNKIPESKVTVRFPDCDPFNHLNNARYIEYFLNTREDHLWDYYQFDLYGHTRKTGKGWMVTKNQILYLRPAALNEQVVIQSSLLRFDRNSLLVEMTMWDEPKSQIKAILWSTFTYVDLKNQRRAVHESGLLELFKELQFENNHPATFDERIQQLKKSKESVG